MTFEDMMKVPGVYRCVKPETNRVWVVVTDGWEHTVLGFDQDNPEQQVWPAKAMWENWLRNNEISPPVFERTDKKLKAYLA